MSSKFQSSKSGRQIDFAVDYVEKLPLLIETINNDIRELQTEKADRNIVPTKLSDITDDITEQTYNSTSIKPQSGKAIAGVISGLLDRVERKTFDGYIEATLNEDNGIYEFDFDSIENSGVYLLYEPCIDDDNAGIYYILSVDVSYDNTLFYQTLFNLYSGEITQRLNKREWRKISVSQTDLDKKVDKIKGKGLSTNDFTDALKNKLEDMSEGGGGSSITVDDKLSATSTNPVQNKVITAELNNKADANYVDELGAAIEDTYLLAEKKVDKEKNKTLLEYVPIKDDYYVRWERLNDDIRAPIGVSVAFASSQGNGVLEELSDVALVLSSYTDDEIITVITSDGEIYRTKYVVDYEDYEKTGWTEWKKMSVTQTDLNTAIGDIETSLDNIIKKYGLGGDGV